MNERIDRFPHGPVGATSPPNDVYEINSELARKINEEARRDPKSPYAGKFVGIANGQVVVVTDNLDDLARRLEEIEPDPMRTFCVEASADYDSVYEV
jgi:hypothetical protein